MAREAMRDMLSGVEYVGKPKLVERNTVRYTRPNGDNVIRLHSTDIITKRPDGSTVLNTGGWKTVTTKDRLNKYADGVQVFSDRGVWYLSKAGDFENRIPFEDGLTISRSGKLPKVRESVAEKQRKLGKQICAFVKLLDGKPLPMPGPGDCWLCAFRDRAEPPPDRGSYGSLGRAKSGPGDASHLLQHIKEGYVHGSLIVNAMRWAGFTDAAIGVYLNGVGSPRHTSVKSALRRYLRSKLGLAT